MEERLQKIMAHAGIGSRRACEEIIKEGRVQVNGKVAHLGQKANSKTDEILVDGEPINAPEKRRYILLNKPFGYITSVKDQFGRKDVLDLLPTIKERVYPVGRLDFDSEGLVFLTNDGTLANKVMHPRYELPKTYHVVLQGSITMDAVYRLRTGILLEDGRTAPAQVQVVETKESSVLNITLREGRNRQVRRMCEKVGFPVQHLTRTSIGPLKLQGLASGEFRNLTAAELKALRKAVKL